MPALRPVSTRMPRTRRRTLFRAAAGYGGDQAYLRYLFEGQRFAPRLVVMGCVPDDINRAVNAYRRFLSPVDASEALSTTTENDVMPLFAEGGHYSTRRNQGRP